MYLQELKSLNTLNARPYKWTSWDLPSSYDALEENGALATARFMAGPNTFDVMFIGWAAIEEPEDDDPFEMRFEVEFQNLGTDLEKGRQGITGTGQAISVFVTVLAIIDEFLAKVQPAGLEFAAEKSEPSRVKLYDRGTRQLAQKHGYQFTRKEGYSKIAYEFNFKA